MKSLKEISSIEKLLFNYYKKSFYSSEEIEALKLYVKGCEINGYLWNKKHYDNISIKSYSKRQAKDQIKDIPILDKALQRLKTPLDITLYSGSRFDPRLIKNKKDILFHPAYVSTTLEKKNIFWF